MTIKGPNGSFRVSMYPRATILRRNLFLSNRASVVSKTEGYLADMPLADGPFRPQDKTGRID